MASFTSPFLIYSNQPNALVKAKSTNFIFKRSYFNLSNCRCVPLTVSERKAKRHVYSSRRNSTPTVSLNSLKASESENIQDSNENPEFPSNIQMWGKDPPNHKSGYVAIIGRPNAGKSTLMNCLVGAKLSIVTYKPQTTRHRVLGIVSDEDSQMILLDTPGVVDTKRNKMEAAMMTSVTSSVKDADVILALIDSAGRSPREALEGMLPPQLLKKGCPLVLVLNKLDLIPEEEMEDLVDYYTNSEWASAASIVKVSAREGTGVSQLMSFVKDKLPLGPSLYPKDVISEHPERFFIAEIVREQIFLLYRQEVPYSATVVVSEYEERRAGQKDHIVAEVLVDRDAQKGIIIGKGGAAMKKLSSAARREIEDFVGKPVYLELIVKVKKGWMEDETMLKKSGLMRNSTASSGLS